MVGIHCDTRQSARGSLRQHLRMPLQFARKEEDVGFPHLFTQGLLREVSEECDIPATVLLRNSPATLLFLSRPRNSELDLWESCGRVYHSIHALVRTERTR